MLRPHPAEERLRGFLGAAFSHVWCFFMSQLKYFCVLLYRCVHLVLVRFFSIFESVSILAALPVTIDILFCDIVLIFSSFKHL